MKKENETYLKENWLILSNDTLCTQLKIGETTLRKYARKLNLPQKTPQFRSEIGITKTPENKSIKDLVFNCILKSKRHYTFEELADKFNVPPKQIREAIETLKAENKNFHFHDNGLEVKDVIETSKSVIDAKYLTGKTVRFGFVTDNHLGSKYERLDVLNAIYKRFQKAGITTVYNAGNIIDGEARFNKFDIHVYGMQNQCQYFAKVYPKVNGIKTYFITGDDHEGWYVQREGVNIGKFMEHVARENGRTDLIYLGHMEHDLILKAKGGQAILRIVHPGGGSSYAYSYTSQKLVESYTPGEKPHILLVGHYHKACYNYIRGVHVLQGGTTMEQSPFMRKKRLEAHIGGWICEYQQGINGEIQSFKAEWIPFFNKEFYETTWNYKYTM